MKLLGVVRGLEMCQNVILSKKNADNGSGAKRILLIMSFIIKTRNDQKRGALMSILRSGKIGTAAIIGLAGILFLLSCGGNSSDNGTNPPPPPTHSSHFHAVRIQGLAFSPSSLSIPAGDTVQWTNNDNTSHTVTSDTGSELAGQLGSGATYQHIFMAAGQFPYHCTIHTTMHGSVTVQ